MDTDLFHIKITPFLAGLTNMIEQDQWPPFALISDFLGAILNFLFDAVYFLTVENSLGFAIILLTIVARTLMLPMGFQQQKSMVAMRRIQPEMEKIKARYAGTKDPEQQRKMNADIQALYAKNKVNPLGGCLPIFITLPIFFALNSVLRNSYLYVGALGQIYDGISGIFTGEMGSLTHLFDPIIAAKIQDGSGITLDVYIVEHLSRALNRFTPAEWDTVLGGLQAASADAYNAVAPLMTQKHSIESFFGIDLIAVSGLSFPGIIIPVLTGLATFLSTWIMNRQQAGTSSDPSAKSQQTIMLVVMPIMMTWMTTSLSAGVGIYWITSSVYQTIQQVLLNKYYTRGGAAVAVDALEDQPKEIIVLDKSINKKKGEK